MISYSRVSLYTQCPYRYYLKYIKGVEVLPDCEAGNALTLGTAMHTAIEKGADEAINWYYSQTPVIDDNFITEALKLEKYTPKVKKVIPINGTYETQVTYKGVQGFIDYTVMNSDGTVSLYDFKYSSSSDRYKDSQQLNLYAWLYEKVYNIKVKYIYYVVIPKVNLRQKHKNKTNPADETIFEFRQRITEEIEKNDIILMRSIPDYSKLPDFMGDALEMLQAETFPKNETKLCRYCEYSGICNEEVYNMILPSVQRRELETSSKRKIWVYGEPFSGKTVFADSFPTPLLLNTDGNYRNVTSPVIEIKDSVTVSGRFTKRKFAWEVFQDTLLELEKGSQFQTIIIDLIDDLHESCRLYMYDKLGITHESDDSFRAWDRIRTEFLSTMRRFFNLNYENLIIISHSDTSRDLTKRSGDKVTKIMPNLPEKVAKKVSGMVDIVFRTVADDGSYMITNEKSEVIFGGGRLNIKTVTLPNNYTEIEKIYKIASPAEEQKKEEKQEAKEEQKKETEEQKEEPQNEKEQTKEPEKERKTTRRRKTRVGDMEQ